MHNLNLIHLQMLIGLVKVDSGDNSFFSIATDWLGYVTIEKLFIKVVTHYQPLWHICKDICW